MPYVARVKIRKIGILKKVKNVLRVSASSAKIIDIMLPLIIRGISNISKPQYKTGNSNDKNNMGCVQHLSFIHDNRCKNKPHQADNN